LIKVSLSVQPAETAIMSELDLYLEYLYDDLPSKIRGTGLILQLARSPDNLAYLMENGMHDHTTIAACDVLLYG